VPNQGIELDAPYVAPLMSGVRRRRRNLIFRKAVPDDALDIAKAHVDSWRDAYREQINTIIFKELVNGVLTEESRMYFNKVIRRMKDQRIMCFSIIMDARCFIILSTFTHGNLLLRNVV
jgi:hypothetical protein